MNIQVAKSHYLNENYDHKARWISYWQQINEVMKLSPRIVLEIGLGNGLVSNYLKSRGVEVKTVDIDESLNPDYIASVLSIPTADNAFDVTFAFEVLEHLSFLKFKDALREMARVSRNYVIISLPDSRHTLIHFLLKLPFLPRIEFFWKLNSRKEHKFDGQHHWEIGKRGYGLPHIKNEIMVAGLRLVKNFVTPDCPTKHFFILEK